MESFQIDINRIKPFRCKSMKIIIYGISSFPAEIQGIEKPINRREELVSPRSNSVHGSSISWRSLMVKGEVRRNSYEIRANFVPRNPMIRLKGEYIA